MYFLPGTEIQVRLDWTPLIVITWLQQRERCVQRKRSDLLAKEHQSYQRRGVTSEWERGRDVYFLTLLYDLSITDWLLDRLNDHDFIEAKFGVASRNFQDIAERRRWLAPL